MIYKEILSEMESEYTHRTGCVPNSAGDIGIRLKIIAKQLADLYNYCLNIRDRAFPDTATGDSLDHLSSLRNITRKPRLRSYGKLRFTRDTPAMSNIVIPKGTVCQTDSVSGIMFSTTEDGVIGVGDTSVDVEAESVDGGKDKNVGANSINLFVTMIQGVSYVTNPSYFSGGSDVESDKSLRKRLVESYKNISNGTNSAFYYNIAMDQEDVHSVKVIPRSGGRGKVAVIVAGKGTDIKQSTIRDLETIFNAKREIGVDVMVASAQLKSADIVLDIWGDEELDDSEVLSVEIQKVIEETLDAQLVGEPLKISTLYKALCFVDGLKNFKVISPSDDISSQLNELIVKGDIRINFMGNE